MQPTKLIAGTKWFVLSAALIALYGCALSEKPSPMAGQAQNSRDQVNAWQSSDGAQVNSLNQLIDSDTLNHLVDEALKGNPSVQQTLITLKIREQQLKQAYAAELPSVSAGFNANKTEQRNASYTGNITVSWEADLWGKLNQSTRASLKDLAQQRYLYQSARDTLAAQVMQAWLGLIAQQHAITIQQDRVKTLGQNQQFILERYRSGLGTLEDLSTARSSAASAKAKLAQQQETLRQQQRNLTTLLGSNAIHTYQVAKDYPDVKVPHIDLPPQTLGRRPDLQAAYQAIQAADLRSQVAYKDLLPSLNIQAMLESAATTPRQALLTSPVWSLLGQLTAPLFEGGKRRAAVKVAEFNAAYAYQTYRDTLLTAVNEVQQAIDLESSLATQQQHVKQALADALSNLTQYQQKYRTGLVSILDLLNVQKQTYDLEAQYDQLRYQRLQNRITLGLALGLGVKS